MGAVFNVSYAQIAEDLRSGLVKTRYFINMVLTLQMHNWQKRLEQGVSKISTSNDTG